MLERKRKKVEKGRIRAGLEPATFCSAAQVTTVELLPLDIITCTIIISIVNLNFHDLTVAVLAALTLPITHTSQTCANCTQSYSN